LVISESLKLRSKPQLVCFAMMNCLEEESHVMVL